MRTVSVRGINVKSKDRRYFLTDPPSLVPKRAELVFETLLLFPTAEGPHHDPVVLVAPSSVLGARHVTGRDKRTPYRKRGMVPQNALRTVPRSVHSYCSGRR